MTYDMCNAFTISYIKLQLHSAFLRIKWIVSEVKGANEFGCIVMREYQLIFRSLIGEIIMEPMQGAGLKFTIFGNL